MAIRSKGLSTPEAFETLHNDLMLDRRVATPGKIVGINIGANASLQSINVQPLIYQVVAEENGIESTLKELPVIRKVPVVLPRAQNAGFSLTQPISIGDDVLLIVSDRAIDHWQSRGVISPPVEPVTPRAHDLTDAIAIIGLSSDMTPISNYSFTKSVLRNVDGTIALELSNTDILLKHGDIDITVTGTTIELVNGSSNIEIFDEKIKLLSGTSKIEMTLNSIEIVADTVTINGIDFSAHIHNIIVPSAGEPTTPPI